MNLFFSHPCFKTLLPFWVLVIVSSLHVLFLGSTPFFTPDEARYVEIAREMVVSNDWITPRLNGVSYFEKPPLLYWIHALLITHFGVHEEILRLPSVVFSLLSSLMTYGCVANLLNRENISTTTTALIMLILTTCPLHLMMGRLITLDMALSFCVVGALLCFFKGVYALNRLKRRFFLGSFSVFCALGVLTKGIVILALCGPIILIWLFVLPEKKRPHIFPLFLGTNTLIFLIIALPWHILVYMANFDFFHKYVIVEHWLRYTTTLHERSAPFWFFIPILFLGTYPYGFYGVRYLRELWISQQPLIRLCVVWVLWVVIFFSCSGSKLIPYILPAIAPFSIMCFYGLTTRFKKNLYKEESPLFELLPHVGIFLVLITILFNYFLELDFLKKIHIKEELIPLILGFLVANALVITLLVKPRIRRDLVMLCYGMGISLSAIAAMPKFQRPSTNRIVDYIKERKRGDDLVVSFQIYPQDVPVYLNDVITVAAYRGELDFGMDALFKEDPRSQRFIDENTLLSLWNQKRRLYVICKKNLFSKSRLSRKTYTVLCANSTHILISNHSSTYNRS